MSAFWSEHAIRSTAYALETRVEELGRSEVLRAALGDDVVDHYVHAGEWEQAQYDKRVTDFELFRNFERA